MKQSLRQKLIDKFQSRYRSGKDEPVHSQVIDDWGHTLGYKHETVGRQLRALAEEGILKATYKTMKNTRGETVYYSYNAVTERDLLVRKLHDENSKR